MTVIEKLGELQEHFFNECGDLYENIEILGAPFYNLMLEDMKSIYKELSKALLREAKIDFKTEAYKLNRKERELLPGRLGLFHLFRRNEPADIIYREVWAEAQAMFNRRTEALERLEAALKQCDNADQRAVFDEPQVVESNVERSERHVIVFDEPQDELEAVQEVVEQIKTVDNVAPMQNTEPTKGPGKTQPKGKLRGQMSFDDVQTSEQRETPDTARTQTLTAEKKAVKPQTRTKEKKTENNSK